MFNKDVRLEKFKDAETVIGASIKVKGNFHGQGNIVVEGTLEGSLKTDANLFVGEKAKITANIEAQEAVVNGEIKGNLKIKKYLAIGKMAKIIGDIQYGQISIEQGALINGQLFCGGDDKKTEHSQRDKDLELDEKSQ